MRGRGLRGSKAKNGDDWLAGIRHILTGGCRSGAPHGGCGLLWDGRIGNGSPAPAHDGFGCHFVRGKGLKWRFILNLLSVARLWEGQWRRHLARFLLTRRCPNVCRRSVEWNTSSTALITEMLLTFGLVSVILGTASGAQNVGLFAAVGVAGYITLCWVVGSTAFRASMNPARTFGPNLVGGHLDPYWIYVCPLTGAALAVGFAFALRGSGGGRSGSMAARCDCDGHSPDREGIDRRRSENLRPAAHIASRFWHSRRAIANAWSQAMVRNEGGTHASFLVTR